MYELIEFQNGPKGDIISAEQMKEYTKDYGSIDAFNSGQCKYYIKQLPRFSVSYSITGSGEVEVYARSAKEAEVYAWEHIDNEVFIREACFKRGLELGSVYNELGDKVRSIDEDDDNDDDEEDGE